MITNLIRLVATVAALAVLTTSGAFAQADSTLSRDAVLRDPDIPVLGNPDGDITIVEFFDFQCPYCKQIHSDLIKVVKEDGKIRLVYKDWPILGELSVVAAKLVLAAKFQGKYAQAHDALITYKGRITAANIPEIVSAAGVDIKKATADFAANDAHVKDILVRNNAQAEAFGFNGTPSFIVGTFRVPGVLTPEQFKQAIKDARARQQSPKPD
ncbi:MAG: DsbA family protein [Xanthobacteraceae bacterium]